MADERKPSWQPTHRLLAQRVRVLGRIDDRYLIEHTDGSLAWIDDQPMVPVEVIEREATPT